jgi:hypothetical protein
MGDDPFKRIGCVGGGLIFVAAAYLLTPAEPNNSPPPLTLDQAEFHGEIELAVKRQLKDPESAEFVHGANGCGVVNAKNSFGGYVGRQRFIAQAGGDAAIESESNHRAFDKLWRQHC